MVEKFMQKISDKLKIKQTPKDLMDEQLSKFTKHDTQQYDNLIELASGSPFI